MTITDAIHQAVLKVPGHRRGRRPSNPTARSATAPGSPRLAGDCLNGWPKGMRLIVRKERPHPGAQLRFTDADGMRLT